MSNFLEFQAGSCLYVTVAVKAASHFGTAYVAAAAEACSRLVGVCRDLGPLPPPTLPFFSLCLFGVYLNVPLRFTPIRGAFLDACAKLGAPVFVLFPLSLFLLLLSVPGCFCHSWEPFSSSLGVALDACVAAGNTFFSFPFFFSFFSSLPLPPVETLEWDATLLLGARTLLGKSSLPLGRSQGSTRTALMVFKFLLSRGLSEPA